MNKIQFKYDPPYGDRRYFIDEEDVKVLLTRLPEELYHKLSGVFFKDKSAGGRKLGYVTRGRRDIVLCALAPRVSLTSYLRRSQNPSMFGAVKGCQWPTLAIRRFMLYDVFLHELGHLQIVNQKSKTVRLKYAGETKAQDFAEFWCKKLWSEYFDHPDPVHNSPSDEEQFIVNQRWAKAHNEYKKGLLLEEKEERSLASEYYSKALDLYESHSLALEALGIYNYDVKNSNTNSVYLLTKAIEYDPTLHDANLFLGLSLAEMNNKEEAKYFIERAIKISSHPPQDLAVYGRVLAKWGYWEEANNMFVKALRKNSDCPFIMQNYKIFLLQKDNPQREINLIKKKALFDEEDLKIKHDKISIYSRGLQINYWFD